METKTKTIYVPIPIAERLPKEDGSYICLCVDESVAFACLEAIQADASENTNDDDKIMYWLEKQEGVYVFTPNELHQFKLRLFAEFENDFNQKMP